MPPFFNPIDLCLDYPTDRYLDHPDDRCLDYTPDHCLDTPLLPEDFPKVALQPKTLQPGTPRTGTLGIKLSPRLGRSAGRSPQIALQPV
jgi:hypothetical protein